MLNEFNISSILQGLGNLGWFLCLVKAEKNLQPSKGEELYVEWRDKNLQPFFLVSSRFAKGP
jgi:hypothetical protein